jgi:hypothetical protein
VEYILFPILSCNFANVLVLGVPVKAAIEMQKVTYTSTFRYNDTSKTYYREFDSSQPRYVGTPTPQIDKAWEELLAGTSRLWVTIETELTGGAGQYPVLSQEEALQQDNLVQIKGSYLAE